MRQEYEVFFCLNSDLEGPLGQFWLLEQMLADAAVEVGVDNNGVGFYEYQGVRGFDSGTNYLVVKDHEDITVRALVNGVGPEECEDLEQRVLNMLNGAVDRNRIIELAPHKEDGPCAGVEAVFKKRDETVDGNGVAFTFDVEWTIDGEVC